MHTGYVESLHTEYVSKEPGTRMGIREGLLTLLARGPAHGYQLKLDFEAATAEAWPLNVGQVYTTLQRLERDGLVEVVETDDEGRVIYAITAAGREAHAGWMLSPVERTVQHRDEISMKLLLAMASGVVDPIRVIAVQRDATMTAIQAYTRLKAGTDPDDLAWLLHVDRLILHAEAELRWLERVEDRLGRSAASERRPATPAPDQPVPTLPRGDTP
jgi:DNA-binding PadR family transcriptional regulator